ncbi:hypothetical protein NDU88_001924 [Pleurodeles waltl]|uniref:Uncharacterized protein n=1 Tax=Pleurodeles waltl TaxID=8319 RepID=A0AAV7M6P2_PLEWA|nr:hypothetical protein NDU88_001924 [Pleurodeles waltl]
MGARVKKVEEVLTGRRRCWHGCCILCNGPACDPGHGAAEGSGRLDLIAAPAAPRERPTRRAASGVAAAVAAYSPPRGRQQVSRAGMGRSGRLASAAKGRIAGARGGSRALYGRAGCRASELVVLGVGREPPRIPCYGSRGGACLCRGRVR